jgi:DNA-binding NtrC family response regulator
MRQEFKILMIEDSESIRKSALELLGVYNDVKVAQDLAEGRKKLQSQTYEVVILDKFLPDGLGLDLLPEIKAESPSTVVIVLTSDDDFNSVRKCITAGADDYIVKSGNIIPDLLIRIPVAVSRAATDRRLVQLESQVKRAFRYELVGKSKAINELRASIHSQKGSKSPVLITGESGTGKEVIARRLNAIEEGKGRPFVAINCGAIPENLIESELFGHKKGAFTGAHVDQPGKFELADGGDLFLDEIGELPYAAQSKLLRVLQDQRFFRVGGNRMIEVSCRIIAATNQNLEELVRKKKFREDLYYRLNVVRFKTSPLRTRMEDIPDLVPMFLMQLGFPSMSLTERAYSKLSQHDWPGNVRELGNVLERGIISARNRKSTRIDHDDLSIDQPLDGVEAGDRRLLLALPNEPEEVSEKSYQEFMELAEREFLRRALALHDGSTTLTAASIGLSRTSMFRKVTQFGLAKKTQETVQ